MTFLPFDVLALEGDDLTKASYLERRAELAELDSVIQDVGGLPITVPPHWENQSTKIMLNAAKSAEMEGILAKRSTSIYLPGQRSRSWVKHAIRTRSSVLVIGFVGSSRSVAALILGAYDAEGRLVQVGSVSSGLTVSMRRQLREDFRPLERPSSPLTDPSAAAETFPGVSVAEASTGRGRRVQGPHGGWAAPSLAERPALRRRFSIGSGGGSVARPEESRRHLPRRQRPPHPLRRERYAL
ncbi:DNA ligase [Rhodococcus opacus PD630]|nr:DNA ligase [Rhodococcus opacus PD630]